MRAWTKYQAPNPWSVRFSAERHMHMLRFLRMGSANEVI